MTRLRYIAGLVFDQPLLIEPRKAHAIAQFLAARMVNGAPPAPPLATSRRDRAELDIRKGGVAVIDVTGVLVYRAGQMDADSTPLLSYEQIGSELEIALAAPDVTAIVLRIDSPGGEVAGAFDLADKIFAARAVKPIVAVAADAAMSAAYLIASAAERVIVSKSAITGSIGVVLNRLDITKALEAEGVQVIQIAQGARKLDGSPVQPWKDGSDEDKALREHTAALFELFVNAVATYRGISADAVRETNAATYVGVDAIDAGLADELLTLDDVVASFADSLNGGSMRLSRAEIERQYPEVVAAIRAEARGTTSQPPTASAEQERILMIQALGGPKEVVLESITSGRDVGAHAVAVLRGEKRDRHSRLDALRADEAAVEFPSGADASAEWRGGEAIPAIEVARRAQAYQAACQRDGIHVGIAEAVAHVRQALGLNSTPHLDASGTVP